MTVSLKSGWTCSVVTVWLKIQIFWAGQASFSLKMEAACLSRTSVAQYNIPQDLICHECYCENLKFLNDRLLESDINISVPYAGRHTVYFWYILLLCYLAVRVIFLVLFKPGSVYRSHLTMILSNIFVLTDDIHGNYGW